MASEVTEISNFPAGTKESDVKAVQLMRLSLDAKSCEYEGSQADGWKMTTIWVVPD